MLARRLAVLTASTAVLLGLIASPMAAGGGRTIRVDDDGHASATDCGASGAAPHRIQAAVDAARPGDTIVVCPGTYRGWVTVRTSDLTIRGERPWTATLLPGTPKLVDDQQRLASMITVVGADDVRVQWLRFLVNAPLPPTVADPLKPPCGVLAAIRLTRGADRAVIRGNRTRAQGPGTLGICGYASAVLVDGGSSATVGYNAARDFQGEAFVATDPGSVMTAFRNSVRFWHLDATYRGPGGSGAVSCYYGAGIVLSDGATGTVARNRIIGRASAVNGSTPLLCPGIYLPGAGSGVIVRHNVVRWAFDGINTDGVVGAIVEGNTILDSANDGIRGELAQDSRFEGNLVRRSGLFGIIIEYEPDAAAAAAGAGYGPRVAGTVSRGDGTGNRFLDNGSFASGRADCRDGTTGDRSKGTANTWRGNRSDGDDRPNGICPAS